MILDGFGLTEETRGNAVKAAKKPNIDALMRDCPFVEGQASGLFVGLHGTVGLYNIATHWMDYRIQDRDGRTPAYGGGLNLGWKFRLDRARADRWGLELSVGYGYLHLDYDKFVNIKNGPWAGSFVEDYLGLDHASVAFTYRFGK